MNSFSMKSKVTQKSKVVSNGTAPPIDAILELLKEGRRVLVASHVDPDGDAIGTQLAFVAYLKQLGKEVAQAIAGEVPGKYRFLSGAVDIPSVKTLEGAGRFDTAVILECPNLERTGQVARLLNDGIRIINIDHHRDNDLFGAVNWINTEASSVGEMTFELFERAGFEITREVAEQLYTAIMTDTGRFRYRSTSPRTLEIAGKLIGAGADPQRITDEVYYNLQPSTMKLIGKVLNSIEFHHQGRVCLLMLTKEMLRQSEAADCESDGLVDYTLFNSGVISGALLKEIDRDHTKVSLRSKDGINVAEIAGRFGGGGHFNASGCTVDMSIEDARKHMVKILSEAIDERQS